MQSASIPMRPIAHFHSPFPSKFGIPRQSGLVPKLEGKIVFVPEWRNPDALRGIEGFDYLWLLWVFSANTHASDSPLVRPPMLGGNQKVGVFASRSPFRPNPIGLSSVHVSHIEWSSPSGPVIHVEGADIMDNTPILDIKPYLSYTDSHPQARNGFSDSVDRHPLPVDIPQSVREKLPTEVYERLKETLSLNPCPRYQADEERSYGMPFMGYDVRFRLCSQSIQVTGLFTLDDIT